MSVLTQETGRDETRLICKPNIQFTEAIRVYEFRALLESATSSTSTEDANSESLLKEMGDLMNQSYESGRDDCENSCAELDELIALARRHGALGSRVTGAGWGGCSVHLLAEPDVPAFVDALKREYYAKRFPDLRDDELDDSLFATKPESGACLFKVE